MTEESSEQDRPAGFISAIQYRISILLNSNRFMMVLVAIMLPVLQKQFPIIGWDDESVRNLIILIGLFVAGESYRSIDPSKRSGGSPATVVTADGSQRGLVDEVSHSISEVKK